MGKPAVPRRTVPVLDLRWDIDHIAWVKFPGWLAPLLIISPPGGTEKNLAAAMVNVPVVSAAGRKGHIGNSHSFGAQWTEIAGPAEILSCSGVGPTPGKEIVKGPTHSQPLLSLQLLSLVLSR